MPLKTTKFHPAARAAVAAALVAAVTLAGCQTSRDFMRRFSSPPAQPAPPKKPSSGASADLSLLGKALDASPANRATLLTTAQMAYQAHPGARQTLQLALLLAAADPPVSDLQKAQALLQGLLADAHPDLEPDEQNLARLELVLIRRQLTLQTENRTLRSTNASQLSDLNRQLRSAVQQNVSLKRQLGEARAKLAAITNIEKSMNEGKLGNGTPP